MTNAPAWRVAHLTQSVTTLGGGISEAVRALAAAQADAGLQPRAFSVADPGRPLPGWTDGGPVLLPGRKLPGMTFVPGLAGALDDWQPDVLHTHGLWTYLSIGGPAWAREARKPRVVSPHGMLDPWALAHSRWKKRLALRLYESRHLRGATLLHALCEAEAESIRRLGLRNPVAVIPNGVDLPAIEERPPAAGSRPRVLLFLGRLHPKKGLAAALRAWAKMRGDRDWQFVIAGWDQDGHRAELEQICRDLGTPAAAVPADEFLARTPEDRSTETPASVLFVGPAFGETKAALLRRADAFILPSLSEGLPVSVLEAWAHGLPVMMTDRCNLPEGFQAGAAIRIETEPASIAAGFAELTSADQQARLAMGANGRNLVQRNFTWPRVADAFARSYRWLAGEGPRPDFVV